MPLFSISARLGQYVYVVIHSSAQLLSKKGFCRRDIFVSKQASVHAYPLVLSAYSRGSKDPSYDDYATRPSVCPIRPPKSTRNFAVILHMQIDIYLKQLKSLFRAHNIELSSAADHTQKSRFPTGRISQFKQILKATAPTTCYGFCESSRTASTRLDCIRTVCCFVLSQKTL